MRVSVIKNDNAVYVDGVPMPVDCSHLPANFWALQWEGSEDGKEGEGEIEFSGRPKPENEIIEGLGEYMSLVEAWKVSNAAHQKAIAEEKARNEALAAAPQE
jgi:hypothetical protein